MVPVTPSTTWKMCKHCDMSKPHQIREVKSRGLVAVRVGEGVVAERVRLYQATYGGTFEKDDWLCSKFQAKLMNCYRKNARKSEEAEGVANRENVEALPREISTRSKQLSNLESPMTPPPRKYLRRGDVAMAGTASVFNFGQRLESSDQESQGQGMEAMEYEVQREAMISVDSEGFSATSSEPPLQAEAVYSDMSEQNSADFFSQQHAARFQVQDSKKVKLENGLLSVPFSESCCVICGIDISEGRKSVPGPAKKELWMENGIYLPKGVRCCMKHISDEIFDKEAKLKLDRKKRVGVKVSKAEIAEWLRWLTDLAKVKTRTVDFDDPKTESEAYEELLGLNKDQFNEVFEYIREGLLNSRNRSPRNALAENFVPSHLGFKHMSRDQIMEEHNPSFVREMFEVADGKLAFILDGTYFYIQSSGDFVFQGKTYSSHKHRHLVKFMMVITPDGYIIDCVGAFPSNNQYNDANILSQMLHPEKYYNMDGSYPDDPILSLVESGDHFILDRGFRDVQEELAEEGIVTSSPLFLTRGKKAFDCLDANLSRKVTMVRWPVEAVNGRVKNKFDFFDNVVPNSYMPMMHDLVRISCAMINKFGKPFFVESEKHERILERVRERLEMHNLMEDRVKEFDLKKNVHWNKAAASTVVGFPRLSEQDVKNITLGPYQIAKGERYIERDLRMDPSYTVMVHKEMDGIIRVKLQSRYRRAITHNVWIEFKDDPLREPCDRILGYFCWCEQGARNLGCCAHVAAILLYLGRDIHEPPKPKKRRVGVFLLLDAAEAACRKEAADAEEAEGLNGCTESQVSAMEQEVESEEVPPELEDMLLDV